MKSPYKLNNLIIVLTIVFCGFIIYNKNLKSKEILSKTTSDQEQNTDLKSREVASDINLAKSKIKNEIKSEQVQKTDVNLETIRFNEAVNNIKKYQRIPTGKSTHKKQAIKVDILKNTTWEILSQTRVIQTSDGKEPQDWLFKLNNTYIVEDKKIQMNLEKFDKTNPIVVFDQRLKKPGIITGVLKIQTKNKNQLIEDLKKNQAEIADEFDTVNTYFIKSQLSVFNLNELYKTLKALDYISHVELEIMSKNYVKK